MPFTQTRSEQIGDAAIEEADLSANLQEKLNKIAPKYSVDGGNVYANTHARYDIHGGTPTTTYAPYQLIDGGVP